MSNQEEQVFRYTYSAEEEDEIRRIRRKYVPQEESKIERLRRLDRSVTQKGTVVALILGVLGTLILGVGMCCVTVWQGDWFIPGIFIGLVGIAVLALAYPLYRRITERERERLAPEILRLTEELMQ